MDARMGRELESKGSRTGDEVCGKWTEESRRHFTGTGVERKVIDVLSTASYYIFVE